MGLSRRQFTKEFKLAAVRRLEQGVSISEAARGLEVNPNVLHRWRREFRQGTGNALPGNGKQRWSEGRIAELERKVGQQALEIDFLKGCLQRIEQQRMLQASSGNPRSTGKSRKKWRPNRGLMIQANGGVGPGQPVWPLPVRAGPPSAAGYRHGIARRYPSHRSGVAELRTAAHYGGLAPAGVDGALQAGPSSAAGRQPAVPPQTKVRDDHGLQPPAQNLPEPGRQDDTDGGQSI